jgi:HAD superfamily hydrolase (TIGR01509 family)
VSPPAAVRRLLLSPPGYTTQMGRVMVTGVIFDIDGTLVDSVDLHAQAWQEAFRHFGFDIPYDTVRGQIGKGGDQLLPALLPKDVVKEKGEEIDKYRADLFKREYMPKVRPFPAVRELFERIKRDGKRVALASSAKGPELKEYKRLANIGDLIEAETSSDDAEKSKPHPDIFEAALDRLGGIDPAEVVVVGDTPYDAEAAGKAGLRTVGVLCGGFPADRLRAAGCVALYRDPADLLRQYEASPLGEK